tara:strand:+ start:1398 stop:2195 length:798 start_codon:yes stop_codon:yes gene_type:complete
MTFCATVMLFIFTATCLFSPQTVAKSQDLLVNKLSDDAYVLRFSNSWTNIGLLQIGNSVVLIDPAAGNGNLEALTQFMKDTFQYSSCYVLNTHEHPDHTSGNDYFLSKGCPLIDNVDNLEGLQALNFDAHTLSDRVFYHQASNSMFIGDIYETRGRALPTFWSGGMAALSQAVDGILALGDDSTVIIPGHGAPTNNEQLAAYRTHSADWLATVKTLSGNGLSARKMSQNEEVQRMVERFNINGMTPYINEPSLIRFIEKTEAMLE